MTRDETDVQLPVTAEWRQQVRTALRRDGKNQEWLAKKIGVTPTTITRLIGGKPENQSDTSEHVMVISRLLGVQLPAFQSGVPSPMQPDAFPEGSDGDVATLQKRLRLIKLMSDIPDGELDIAIAIAEKLQRK